MTAARGGVRARNAPTHRIIASIANASVTFMKGAYPSAASSGSRTPPDARVLSLDDPTYCQGGMRPSRVMPKATSLQGDAKCSSSHSRNWMMLEG